VCKLSHNGTAGILCIDEGLDCIDVDNWQHVLDCFNNFTDVYTNIIFITHLELNYDISKANVLMTNGISKFITF